MERHLEDADAELQGVGPSRQVGDQQLGTGLHDAVRLEVMLRQPRALKPAVAGQGGGPPHPLEQFEGRSPSRPSPVADSKRSVLIVPALSRAN